jgi:F420H(2)-dependent quinone reductase
MAKYIQRPRDWAREQFELYESSGGTKGTMLRDAGLSVIILTHAGNKTRAIPKTPLMRVRDGESCVLARSRGGVPNDPTWVHNLRANPNFKLRDETVVRLCARVKSKRGRNARDCRR